MSYMISGYNLVMLDEHCMYDNAAKRKLYFVTGPPSPHLHKTIVKSIIILTKWFLGKLYYMVQNEVNKFTIDIHSKFDITLNHLM